MSDSNEKVYTIDKIFDSISAILMISVSSLSWATIILLNNIISKNKTFLVGYIIYTIIQTIVSVFYTTIVLKYIREKTYGFFDPNHPLIVYFGVYAFVNLFNIIGIMFVVKLWLIT